MMDRRVLRDDQWQRIEHLLPGKATDRGVTAKDNRLFLEAVLWIGRTGAPWRDLPAELGHWHTTFTRFARWAKTGVWERVFRAVSGDPDLEEVMLDSTAIRAHQHAAGAQKNMARRLWAVLEAGSAPKSMASSMPSAIRSASRLPAPSKQTSAKPLPCSIRPPQRLR
jgi:putative transposase